MAYSALAHSFPDFIRQPTTISLLASLGLHGLFALGFPNATKPLEPLPEPVKVVELTPAEQSRLPRTSSPYLPQTPLPSNLPSNQSPSLSSLFPSLPPGRSSALLPPSGLSPSQNLPLTTQPPRSWPWPVPPRSTPKPVNPPKPGLTIPTGSITLNPMTPADLGDPIGTLLPPASPGSSPSPSPSPDASPSPSPSPTSVTRPDRIPESAIARMRELQAQKRASRQAEEEDTGAVGSEFKELGDWLEKNNASLEGSFEVKANHPDNLKGTAIVAVIVDADGKIVADNSQVVQKSGNKALDDAALDVANNQTLPPPKKGQAYLIVVKFGGETSAQPTSVYGS